jgi:NAD+ kinase
MKPVKSAVVVANPSKKNAIETRKQVLEFLGEKGVRISGRSADLFIAIGGDGTVLFNKGHFDKPIFAIGSESSFICQAQHHDWKEKLGKILGGFQTEERAMLSSELDGKKLPDALNEVCVRNKEHRILAMHLKVDKKDYAFRADGVLFSTATGSTAYSYSCGGEEMGQTDTRCQIVAIAPYRRSFEPMIVPQGAISTLIVESECDADVVIDGQHVFPLERSAVVKVYASGKKAKFALV